MSEETHELFLTAPPGLEDALQDEAADAGFAELQSVPGGVIAKGGLSEAWRANLVLRGATRVLLRIGSFRAMHLAQLDKRARKFPWDTWLRQDQPMKVEATCRQSRIYHAGAARQRIERALQESFGLTIADDAAIRVLVRIEDDLCILSLDTSGEPLHRRGTKEAVGKAPLRETMAALFLRQCGYDGRETVVDPMCGSGTFLLEASGLRAGHQPGAHRAFAFEQFAGFDPFAFQSMRTLPAALPDGIFAYGYDRDAGAIERSRANAERAGLSERICFETQPISELTPPEGPPGLLMVNPPYGGRIGNKRLLFALYGQLGQVLKERFSGWRVGLVTSETSLARATGLPFLPPGPPIPHGGLKIRLHRTGRI
ncbi:putative N6-adenine-specific DNA methylase [Poseidonocella pacifica]|uniref:Putative N6-adenine-specific DNA methylase n=1 Tax=Poseidonocella pacifica TaxID=871651 RepID=A0A1I0WRJ9_9RHOB|nr:RNA methyltransferase [Poseidonocella pacifica]SFA90770.1 putative N6-adenine-specific DNA methylase [Poseidonocella pacifica]